MHRRFFPVILLFLLVHPVFFSSMYILLRGQVTVYHTHDVTAQDGSDNAEVDAATTPTTDGNTQLRHQLGAFVVTLSG